MAGAAVALRRTSTSSSSLLLLCGKANKSLTFQRRREYVKISPAEATAVLQGHEYSEELNYSSIKSFDANQLLSNNPVEDARAEARTLYTTGTMFGVFDGHGGPSCAQVVANRLLEYVAASLLPSNMIKEIIQKHQNKDLALLQLYNDHFQLVEDLTSIYDKNFESFLRKLEAKPTTEFHMEDALVNAFLSLDNDILEEAKLQKLDHSRKTQPSSVHLKTLSVALSGSVGCLAHVDNEHLHVANVGDCRVVLGTWDSEHENWSAHVITEDHNSDNLKEVKRILSEHPENEKDSIIRNDRLFGQLAPLRAFGDVRFKWSEHEIRDYLVPVLGEQAVILSSHTPPYLTAKPDVFYHKLRASDKFMILATDGLWDLLSPSQAVRLIGEHMFGKVTLKPFYLPEQGSVSLGSLHTTLSSRMEASKLKPTDANAATHLIRYALGGTEHGFDHQRLCQLLTLPHDSVRLFRDDITATIVYFDSEFLSSRPL